MENTKPFQAVGEEARTEKFFVDAAGKPWPIYTKIIDMGAGPNAGAKSVAHGVANIKFDGHFKIAHGQFTKAATAPVVMDGAALIGTLTTTNVVLTSTADLTTYSLGRAYIEYTKTTD